jgi:hypothetical protein
MGEAQRYMRDEYRYRRSRPTIVKLIKAGNLVGRQATGTPNEWWEIDRDSIDAWCDPANHPR